MTADLRDVALIGCGEWGVNLARNLEALGALRWVCETDEEARSAAARRYPEARTTATLDDVLADDGVRGAVVATPASSHADLVLRALAAGKDVFVEKPLALHFEEGRDLVAAADAAGAILMVGHVWEYHPGFLALRGLVESGELGALRYVYSSRLKLGRVRREENILWSFAPHDISMMLRLAGAEPESVTTTGGSFLQEDIADVTVTGLRFPGEIRGHIFVSWLHPTKEQQLVVVGERKMAIFEGTDGGRLTVYDRGIEWDGVRPVERLDEDHEVFFDRTEPALLECGHFLECIRERRTPRTDGRSGLAVVKVLEASQRSFEAGGVAVSLSEIGAGASA